MPIPSALRELLVAELLRTGRRGGDLIFGSMPDSPFKTQGHQYRADKAWEKATRILVAHPSAFGSTEPDSADLGRTIDSGA